MKPKYKIGQRLWRHWDYDKETPFDYPATIKEIHIVMRKKNKKIVKEIEYVLIGYNQWDGDIVSEKVLFTTKEKDKFLKDRSNK